MGIADVTLSTGENGKCMNCGLVNWPSAEFCKRCGVKLDPETPRNSSPKSRYVKSGGRNILRNLQAFLAGLGGSIAFFLTAVVGWHSVVPFAILFASLGILFGYLYSKKRWQMAIWLSLSYLILITWIVIGTIQYNAQWENVFWRTEVFYGTMYVNLSPVIAAFLGVLIGSKRSLIFSVVLIGVIVLALGCERYMLSHSHVTLERNGSLEISSEEARLRVDLHCGYTKSYDYRNFRYFDTGGCGDSRITVLSKNPIYSLPTKAAWVIDGNEIAGTMWPINGPGDRSSINRFDDHAYDDVSRWRATIPITSIMKAHQVEFRWGSITIPLQSEQLETLKNLQREFEQLCRDL